MREPRWLRPLARVYLIVTTAMWVTASALDASRSVVGGVACEAARKGTQPVCAEWLPIWAGALVGVVGVLSAYGAARLTRPRSA